MEHKGDVGIPRFSATVGVSEAGGSVHMHKWTCQIHPLAHVQRCTSKPLSESSSKSLYHRKVFKLTVGSRHYPLLYTVQQ